MPVPAIAHAMRAPKGPVAVANRPERLKIPAPTIEPMTMAVSEESGSFSCSGELVATASSHHRSVLRDPSTSRGELTKDDRRPGQPTPARAWPQTPTSRLGFRAATAPGGRGSMSIPPAAMIWAIGAPNGAAAFAKVWDREKKRAPIVKPLTSADDQDSESSFVDDDAIRARSLRTIFTSYNGEEVNYSPSTLSHSSRGGDSAKKIEATQDFINKVWSSISSASEEEMPR